MTHNRSRHRRESAWFLYDHLGALVRLNLLWLLASLTIIGLPAATLALAASIDRLADGEKVRAQDFFALIRRFAFSGTLLGALHWLVWQGLVFEMNFYLERMDELHWWGAIAWAVGANLAGLLVVFATIETTVMARAGLGIRETIVASWRLALDAPGWGFRGAIAGTGIGCVFVLSGIGGLALGVAAPIAVLVIRSRQRDGQGVSLPGGSSARGLKAVLRPWE